jgi:hypothetical protein
MAWPRSRRIRRTGPGRYAVHLSDDEQALVVDLVAQLRAVLEAGTDDPSLRRLFPTAYHDDAERDQEYQLLARDELLARRLTALDLMATTAAARELDAAGLTAWMGAVNDLRLVIGTNLDVSEDDGPISPDDPDAPARAVYGYLTGLLDDIVAALTDGLGDAEPDTKPQI